MLDEYASTAKFTLFFAAPVAAIGIAFGSGAVIAWVAFVFAVVIGRVALRRWRVNRALRGR